MRRCNLLRHVPPLGALLVLAAAAAALLIDAPYVHELLILAVVYAQFAASWDLLCGPSGLDNFGHAVFIGGAGYGSALLGRHLGLDPLLSVPLAAAAAAVLGALVGILTLRLRGPYFSLATITVAAVGYKLSFILSRFTGGEEGLSGLRPFTRNVGTDLLVCLALLSLSCLGMQAFMRSRCGLVLRATRHNEDAVMASGYDTAAYKILAFSVSGMLAGLGGAMYGHTQMQVNPDLLSGGLSVMVVLLATVGGRGRPLGPALAAALLILLSEGLRVFEQYRAVIFTGLLILLVYLHPEGLANSPWVRRPRYWRRRGVVQRAGEGAP
ncbi:branched-chain amino acid ABC transporter permease [Mitsuaria sp. WAJ17]|uniref:branched-chain amino acid ABC transporter permease n=1 Tax=Mitsuaria sp. WAJ17 TaxID=2761452 RepID=UPI00160024E5|nr:branched-chain amino acid ABC transporter permease [Mitsuaria sp. WAJ17]MBB2485475.1 branched-chain amino acid ABC transporter permease [Mitsuaria sp. WAJ17]